MIRIFFPAGLALMAFIQPLCFGEAEDVEVRRVGVDELVERILANDPDLFALRGDIRRARAEVGQVGAWRDPELRLEYTRDGDRAVPAPYTETLTETVRETRRISGQRSQSSFRSGSESRIDGMGTEIRDYSRSASGQQSRVGLQQETSRRTITREITPTRRGERIVERHTETVGSSSTESAQLRESYRELENRQTLMGDEALTVDGAFSGENRQDLRSREVVTRETITERDYGYDPYEGGDTYSAELRFYPNNPWETHRLTQSARARVTFLERQWMARMHEREIQVREEWADLVLLQQEVEILADRQALFEEESAYQSRLRETGSAGPEGFSRSQLELVETRLRYHEAKRRLEERLTALALESGLDEEETIHLHPVSPRPEVKMEDLDREILLTTALENRPDLERLTAQTEMVSATLEAHKATRIPWLSVISASYQYEERYGGKYRDDYGIMAAVSLPIFSWLDQDLGAGELAELETLRRQRNLLEKRVTARLQQSLDALMRIREDRKTLLAHCTNLRQSIRSQLEQVEPGEPAFHEARLRMRRTLLETRRLESQVEHAYGRALLDLRSVMGQPLEKVLMQEPPSDLEP